MSAKTITRQSISLPARIAKSVRAMAKRRHTSANRVLVELVEAGLAKKEEEKRRLFELGDRLESTSDPAERTKIKEELARIIFGE